MRTFLILILAGITFFEVYQAIQAKERLSSYKPIVDKNYDCPEEKIKIEYVEYNPINDINVDSFLQQYGITEENIKAHPVKKRKQKIEILIEPKKIVPDKPKLLKIKAAKTN